MTIKSKARSRIFEAVHETASDLHRLGFLDKRAMRNYDILCREPIPEYDAERIRALRKTLHVSQTVLAAALIRVCRPCVSGKSATRSRAVHR